MPSPSSLGLCCKGIWSVNGITIEISGKTQPEEASLPSPDPGHALLTSCREGWA